MYGLVFNLETHILDNFGISRAAAYSQVERKLTELGFKHVAYGMFINQQEQTDGAFIVRIARVLAGLEFASAIRDLHGFHIKDCSDLTPEVHTLHRLICTT